MIYHNYHKHLEVFESVFYILAVDDLPAKIQINGA